MEEIIGALKRYVEDRMATGGFLRAVLENDLMEAFGRADERNQQRMFDIVSYIYNNLPIACHGSVEKVNAWLHPKPEPVEEPSEETKEPGS